MPKHWWLEHGDNVVEEDQSSGESHFVLYTEKPSRWHRIKLWQKLTGAGLLLAAGMFIWLWFAIARGMPTLDQLENPHPELATQLISSDGERLDQILYQEPHHRELERRSAGCYCRAYLHGRPRFLHALGN